MKVVSSIGATISVGYRGALEIIEEEKLSQAYFVVDWCMQKGATDGSMPMWTSASYIRVFGTNYLGIFRKRCILESQLSMIQ